MTSLPRDIYSEIPEKLYHNKVKSKCNSCVIIALQYRSIRLSVRDSKIDGVPTKVLGQATLIHA